MTDIYPEPVLPVRMEFSLDYCSRLIGKEIPRNVVETILRALLTLAWSLGRVQTFSGSRCLLTAWM